MQNRWNSKNRGAPRPLSGVDITAFIEAAESKPPRGVPEMRRYVQLKNPVRWRRMQRDFRWMQRKMKKLGLNPEDARWLL